MRCSMCEDAAEIIITWPASVNQEHVVCLLCAQKIWDELSKHTGTDAYNGFGIHQLPAESISSVSTRGASN